MAGAKGRERGWGGVRVFWGQRFSLEDGDVLEVMVVMAAQQLECD